VLRGIFTLRRSELLFFYQDGASHIFPDQFEAYRDFIPEDERHDMIAAYHKRLIGDDKEIQLQAAQLWATWEMATSKLYIDGKNLARGENAEVRLNDSFSESSYTDTSPNLLAIVCPGFCKD
jgi:proline iminopeptidase